MCNKYIYLIITFISGLLWTCNKPRYEGYTKVDDQLYLKLVSYDEEAPRADSCEIFELSIWLSDSSQMAALKRRCRDNMPLWLYSADSDLDFVSVYLNQMQPGDSAHFIHWNDNKRAGEDSVWVALKLTACYSSEQFPDYYDRWLSRRGLMEESRIRYYALEKGFVSSVVQPAVAYRVLQSGVGEPMSYGDELSIHYTGFFLNGQMFDDTFQSGDPLTFNLGQEGQVIKGLEFGLLGCRPGEEREVLVPSAFAFGEKGSSTGIVPPYTPLLFRVSVANTDTASKNHNLLN